MERLSVGSRSTHHEVGRLRAARYFYLLQDTRVGWRKMYLTRLSASQVSSFMKCNGARWTTFVPLTLSQNQTNHNMMPSHDALVPTLRIKLCSDRKESPLKGAKNSNAAPLYWPWQVKRTWSEQGWRFPDSRAPQSHRRRKRSERRCPRCPTPPGCGCTRELLWKRNRLLNFLTLFHRNRA